MYLVHHGILGMKWGVRRYQNKDGTLTEEGKRRYTNYDGSLSEEGKKKMFKGSSSNLTQFGNDVVRGHGKNSDIGKTVLSEQFGRNYSQHWTAGWNTASEKFNRQAAEYNKAWDEKYGEGAKANKEYYEGIGKLWKQTYSDTLISMFGEHPTMGKDWVTQAFGYGEFDDVDYWLS